MSTIKDVRIAEKRVEEILQEFKNSGTDDRQDLTKQLVNATDDYAKAIRELK